MGREKGRVEVMYVVQEAVENQEENQSNKRGGS